MRKTINRGLAVILYNQMATMAFGHLSEETLEAVMDNFVSLGKVAEHYQKLMEELSKRLYEGIDDSMKSDYNEMAKKATAEELEAAFPKLFKLVQKQNAIDASLRSKDVGVELALVDKKEFVKGVLKGKPSLATVVFDLFEPMFKEEEKKEDEKVDFSELDALLK